MSNVCVASCGPLANSSTARGARSMRCRVRLATRYDGRSLMTLKLMLFGVKLRSAGELSGSSGGGRKFAGNVTAVPATLTLSMRPASCVRSVRRVLHLVEEIGGRGPGAGREQQRLARGVELLMAELRPDDAGQGADRRRAAACSRPRPCPPSRAFLKVAGDLLEADVVKPELVVLVVGVAGPVADGVDRAECRAELALAGDLGLLQPEMGSGRSAASMPGM